MKSSRKLLSVVGLLGAPLTFALLSVVAPQAGLFAVFILGVGLGALGFALLLVLIIAAAGGLVTGQNDPLRPFALAVL